eukprot:symbB.v1.2.000654.t1/scaffold28.1/size414311/8
MVDKTKLPPVGCVAVARKEELPAALRPRNDKAAPDALWRKAFNDFCKQHELGKICVTWAQQGSCTCEGPFLHPQGEEASKVRKLLKRFREMEDTNDADSAQGKRPRKKRNASGSRTVALAW